MATPPKLPAGNKNDSPHELVSDALSTEPSAPEADVDAAQVKKDFLKNEMSRAAMREPQRHAEKDSQYLQREAKNPTSAEPGQAFGRKINVNPEFARQVAAGREGSDKSATADLHPQARPHVLQARPMPASPRSTDYQQVLQSRAFQGGLQNGGLQQKIEQQFLTLQQPRLSDAASGNADALTRGELVQLFSMRNRSDINKEERDALRRLIRYEAALQHRSREKVSSIGYQTESNHYKESPDALLRSGRAQTQDLAHRDLLEKLTRSAESFFERVLQKVLGSGHSSVGDLSEGAAAQLPVKDSAEWEAFFQRALGLNSQLVASNVTQEELAQILYRGLVQSEGQLKLVSDVSVQENGEINQYKFAQVLLENPELAKALSTLRPGQILPEELMRALGEQLAILKLVHKLDGLHDLSDAEKQLVLKQFRREVSLGYQSALEKALAQRKSAKPGDPFIWAGDQFDKKEERKGLRTMLTYLSYFVFLSGAGLMVYFIARSFF